MLKRLFVCQRWSDSQGVAKNRIQNNTISLDRPYPDNQCFRLIGQRWRNFISEQKTQNCLLNVKIKSNVHYIITYIVQ